MLAPIFQLVARHAVTAAGTYLATQGYLDAEQTQAFVGAAMTMAGLGWSVFEKRARGAL